jgi:internalin A
MGTFGDNAPVMLVGNKADQVAVNLDLFSLRQKYSNVIDFYPLSCTEAKRTFRIEFERFKKYFDQALLDLGPARRALHQESV